MQHPHVARGRHLVLVSILTGFEEPVQRDNPALKDARDAQFQSSPASRSRCNDFFGPETDFWTDLPGEAVLLYNHGLDDTLKSTFQSSPASRSRCNPAIYAPERPN